MTTIAAGRAAETNSKLGWVANGTSRSRYRNPDLALILPITADGGTQGYMTDDQGMQQPFGETLGTQTSFQVSFLLADPIWQPSWRIAFIRYPLIWSLAAGIPTPMTQPTVTGWLNAEEASDYALGLQGQRETFNSDTPGLVVGSWAPVTSYWWPGSFSFYPASVGVDTKGQVYGDGTGPLAPLFWQQSALDMLELIPDDPTRRLIFCAGPNSLTWGPFQRPYLLDFESGFDDALPPVPILTITPRAVDPDLIRATSESLARKLLERGISYFGYQEDSASQTIQSLCQPTNGKVDFPWFTAGQLPASVPPPSNPADDVVTLWSPGDIGNPYASSPWNPTLQPAELLPQLDLRAPLLPADLFPDRQTYARKYRRHLAYANTAYGQK